MQANIITNLKVWFTTTRMIISNIDKYTIRNIYCFLMF